MKRKMTLLVTSMLALFAIFAFGACTQSQADTSAPASNGSESAVENRAEPVVITVEEGVAEGTTLLAYMEDLQEKGELTFEIANGMITSINGAANDADYDPCWMLYTGDDANANTAWGTYEYEGQTLGSAILGAEALEIVEGEIYVWVYTSF